MSPVSTSAKLQINEGYSFRKISKKEVHFEGIKAPLEVLESCGMLEVIATSSFDFPNFIGANKCFHLINFRLIEEFTGLKGLFNGLISLGQPTGVLIDFEKDRMLYSLKYYRSDEKVVNAYLTKVFDFLSEEIRFKRILRKSIENQEAFAKEEALLKAELFG